MVAGTNWIMKAEKDTERKTKNQNSSLELVFPLKTDWIYLILILVPKLVLTKYILDCEEKVVDMAANLGEPLIALYRL